MSGIVAIFNLDGSPADLGLFERMMDSLAHRGPDGSGHFVDGPVAMGCQIRHMTPESVDEVQPLRDPDQRLCLVFDGRVDNRDELKSDLLAKGIEPRDNTDAELVLRAYQCWGEDSPRRILGDFAFAIWDGIRRELFCARDIAGIIPFYYYSNGRSFVCAPEVKAILQNPAIPREPNEAFIAEYMTGNLYERVETLFQGILRLEPARWLKVNANGITIRQYYDLVPGNPIRYPTDDEYADHFFQIFRESVRCRMRSTTLVGSELSGGLDSSSVVGMVYSLAREGALPAECGFETFSNEFDDPECDEREYYNAVAEFCGFKSNPVASPLLDFDVYLSSVRDHLDFCDYPNDACFLPMRRHAIDKGFGVLFTGLGGDQWMTGTDYYYADLFFQFRFADLVRVIREDGRFPGYSVTERIIRKGLWPLIPLPVRNDIKYGLLGRSPYPAFIDSDFARRVGLAERMLAPKKRPAGLSYGDIAVYDAWADSFMAHELELSNRDTTWLGIEERHPFYDRRLMEFFIAIPEEQRWRGNLIKFVMRQAMRGFIPEKVRLRGDKGLFGSMAAKTLERVARTGVFNSMGIEQRRWVNGDAVRKLYDESVTKYTGYNLVTLWATFATELWLNEVIDHRRELRL